MTEITKAEMLELYSKFKVHEMVVLDGKLYGRIHNGSVVWCTI